MSKCIYVDYRDVISWPGHWFIYLNNYDVSNFDVLSSIRFATLLHSCLASIKKGSKKASAEEIVLASHAIGKM